MSPHFLWGFVTLLMIAKLHGTTGEPKQKQQKRIADLHQPRMTTEGGNLVFLTSSAQNIEFRTGSLGKVKLNNEDLGECIHQIQRNKDDILDLKRNATGLPQNLLSQVHQLNSKLVDLERNFQRLQQNVERKVCSSNPCRNGGTCVNLHNSFFCICPPQWEGLFCSDDVNECAIYSGTPFGCQTGSTCVNTVGSFRCECTPDTYGPQCASKYNDCEQGSKQLCKHGICEDLERVQHGQPKFSCICDAGWTTAPNGIACTEDKDECSLQPSPCADHVQCFNTPGSFYCGACPKGWQGNGYECHDINECDINNGGCSMAPFVPCQNTPGSFTCGNCPPGFSGDGRQCTPLDICLINNGGCHPDASCSSSLGNHSPLFVLGWFLPLCTCLPGYTGNGFGPNGCVPLSNICSSHPCVHGQCIETVSGYFCKCDSGWSGTNCTENINECVSSPCLNGGTCIDGINGFTCDCTSSWTGYYCQTPQRACGGILSGTQGNFAYQSPNDTHVYDVNCFWVVRTDEEKVLHITFTFFDLESSNNCPREFLQIHDGDSSASFPLGRYCGSRPPQRVHSSGNALYFHLYSESIRHGRGFAARWEAKQPECGGTLTGDYGSITSPGYPGNYPPGRDCVWHILVSPGSLITFTFGTLSLENHNDCSKDYLEIRDGPFQHDPVLGKFCTSLSTPPLQTTGPAARIHFHSDADITDKGFHITYLTTPSDLNCGGNYTSTEGELLLPPLTGPFNRNRQCVYLITQPEGEKIDISFTHVELESQLGCPHTYIEVGDHNNLLEKVCGNATLPPIRSISNKVWIRLRIDALVQKASFRAEYKVACGGELTGEGVIRSPFHPNAYPGQRTCRWTISQPPKQIVLLNFTDFQIGNSPCDTDYIEVGGSSVLSSPGNEKFCGTNIPSLYTSVHNAIYVTFVKSSSMENRGFTAKYSTENLECGEVLTAAMGTIESPGYPDIYPSGVNCIWHIVVQQGNLIRLTFDSFSLEFHYNCTNDYLEVYDTVAQTSLGRYCGKSIPPSLTSSSHSIKLMFVSDSALSHEGFSIKYEAFNASSVCLQDYTDNSGTLTSPNFPKNYFNNLDCTYRITVGFNQQIALNFTSFMLENKVGKNCIDFVEIRDGGYETSPLLGRYCGSVLPPLIISHSNKLWLKFKTDSTYTQRGFSASWVGSSTGCGGKLTTSTGLFTSPNYPMPYYHSSECYWWLEASHGSPFLLEFQDFHLEHHPNCSLDYLAVYDGPSTNSHLISKLCGDITPAPIRSSRDSILLKLRTDEGQQGRGFEVKYSQTCDNVVIVNKTYGILESINHPKPYDLNQRCNWTIQATTGNTVNYTFLEFDVEEHVNCSLDYLELYDGPQRIGRYCGEGIPPSGATTGSKLHVLFYTDGVITPNEGFKMQWFVHGCGGEMSGDTGSFSSPGYPNGYPPDKECIWNIHVAPGNIIQLTIHDFDVEYHSNCNYDTLEIYTGLDFHSPRIAQLCSRTPSANPMQLFSTDNELAIRFNTDSSINGRGFNASWRAVPGGCGGIFQVPRGEIHSPNYPNGYKANTECSWAIQVEKHYRVLFNITDFDLEATDSCIMTYDGSSSINTRVANVCGRQKPPTSITSSGNSLFVRFQSGSSSQSRGFRAQFRQECGGHIITDSSDTISSPLFPDIYPNNQNCTWIIEAQPPFNHIALSFSHFQLQGGTDCTEDFLEILDGKDYDAPVRGRYCGASLPRPIISFGNALTLRFVSDSFATFQGFHALYSASTSACGGTFNIADGFFNSPDYPAEYHPNLECIWNIVSSPGNQLQLSFLSFQLENSPNCNKDFVEIREGNATGRLVGRYCGNSIPGNYSSIKGHTLWIRFVSDGSGNGMGFQGRFNQIFGNDNIVGSRGKIASPLWPESYPHNSNYIWTVNVNASQIIRARILEIDMESTSNCNFDKLKIYDGIDIHSRLIGTYCSNQLLDSISSSRNSMTFQFSSDSTISGKGFLLEWFAVDVSPGVIPAIATGACGGYMTTGDTPVLFFSPGWPGEYDNRDDCIWIIYAPDSTVELNIISMDIESQPVCDYDRLIIRDGDNNLSPLLAVLCGRDIPGPIRSTGEYMYIRFTSDSSITGAGFNASFHKSCGGYLHADRGIITSPKYPDTYLPNLNCSWHVLVQSGLTIAVHFEQPFQIQNKDSSCSQGDYLVLRNGPDIHSPPLGPSGGNGRFCGIYTPSTLFTSDNEMFVQFISDNSNGGQGFKIRYEAKSLACGGNIYIHGADSDGYVTSPNYPANYPQNVECIWILEAPSGKSIQLQFEDQFNIEETPNCSSSYLELRDGADSNAHVLSKLCGHSLPSSWVSSRELMYLKFHTESGSSYMGFKAKYSIAPCGGTVSGENGVIESIGYPTLSYPNNVFCEWHLRGLPGHYLTIHFEDFNLQRSSGCAKDFVEIWENHTFGNLLGRYCGNSIPGSIETSSNVALVRFVTDGSVTASGFRLQFKSSREVCGGDLRGTTGTFTSPHYPNPNLHAWICEWTITVPENRRIILTFTNLRLSNHPSCNNEHLIVFNGIRSNSPQLQKLCSRVNVTSEFRSTGNTMKVLFFTDGSRPYGGFSASYTSSEDAVCGGSLPSISGRNFTSPGYNGIRDYAKNLDCEWTLSNPNRENSSIVIHFVTFSLERHQDCALDVLEFRVGDADGPLIEKFCSLSAPAVPLVIPYSQVWIHFVTNEREEHIGFNIEYSFTDCGGIQTGESGVIASPNYPKNYGRWTQCSWLLEAPEGHIITLTFSDFHLENEPTCTADTVTIRNGGSPESPIIGRYCGWSVPGPVQSGSNKLVVTFTTNRLGQSRGFYATWNTGTLGCGGTFHSDNGTIKSPHWPQPFPTNSRCSWTAITHESKHWEISFDSNFRIPSSDSQCGNSFVKVWGGTLKTNDTLLATSCGDVAPSPIVTTGNTFTAVFQSEEMPGQGFSASFISRCGRRFNGSRGDIISPNFPKPYDNNMNCTYFIDVEPQSLVILTFVSFHLEDRSAITGNCDHDGLHIIKGHNLSSTPLATICGSEALHPLTVDGPVLLNFYSNAYATDFGFKISYRVTTCGGIYNKSIGLLRSPSDSSTNYPNNVYCVYTIYVRSNRVILLRFNNFDVAPSFFCKNDHLEVFDGPSIGNRSLGTFCGSRIPQNIKSTNNSLTLLFKTDSSQTARGWEMYFWETLGPHHGCGGYLTDDNNTFVSPDSDSNGYYDKGLNCIWYIIAPENKLINLTFTKFSLEAATAQGSCNYDYVLIADGRSETSDLGGKFCGSQIPAPFISSRNFLTLQFVSDVTFEREGFNATYTFVDMPCGGTHVATLTPQNVSSPHLSNIRRPYSTCTWIIVAPPHKQIKITVWELQLTSQDCSENYLELQDSPQRNGPVTQFCSANFTALPAFYSSRRTAKVVFKSEVLNTNSRVHFTYQIADCNREYNQGFGNLKSPGWPQEYDNNLDCIIILRAPQNHTISLFFYWFELEDSTQCQHDYLEVRNGSTGSSPLLNKYCGSLLPSPVFSQSNELYLRFKTDTSVTLPGYDIIWTSSPSGCGGTLFGDDGIFTSPGYPGSYSNNTHCEWSIFAPSGRPVTIRFPFVSINPPGDCGHNYLIVYNGPDASSPSFGPYCGADLRLAPLTASSNQVFIRFHAEYTTQLSGFEILWDS
ncbi:cubilin isoform X2 [Cricetulus griseus]|uniref:Cubilin n=2 Tax=Cricetulus griseus TaxID=10029 RepID=A0A9J7K3Z1_CRIGR|nr:cubilin isoform X2 [Cricetulus griseus]